MLSIPIQKFVSSLDAETMRVIIFGNRKHILKQSSCCLIQAFQKIYTDNLCEKLRVANIEV